LSGTIVGLKSELVLNSSCVNSTQCFYIFRGPKFELVASGCLTLLDVDDVVRTFDLKLEESQGM